MEDIRFYDFEFHLLHIEHDFTAVNWDLKYNGIGTFEAHFPVSSGVVPVVMGNAYLVAIQGEKQAIVTGVQAGEDFAVYGRTLNWLLSKRTVGAFDTEATHSTDFYTVAKHVTDEAFTKNQNYPVPKFYLTSSAGLRDVGAFWRNTRNPAYDVIHDLCVRADNSGHKVTYSPSGKVWQLTLYHGRELSLMVSEANRNAAELTVSQDCLDFATDGWYERAMKDCGDWEPSKNNPDVTVAHPNMVYNYYRVSEDGTVGGTAYQSGDYILCGLDGYFAKTEEVKPVWERIGSSSLSGIYRWEEKLTGTTPSEAADSLAKKARVDDISATVERLRYGTDYALGDRLRIQCRIGKDLFTYRQRVTELSITYENGMETVRPIFGADENEIVQEG